MNLIGMLKKRTLSFREDLRNKFVRFAIIPILLLGIFGSVIVYNAEENIIIDNHTNLLISIDNRIKNFYEEVTFLCQALQHELKSNAGDLDRDLIEDALIYNKNLHSIFQVDMDKGTVQEVNRTLQTRTRPIDSEIRTLIAPVREGNTTRYRTDAYYASRIGRVVVSCVLRQAPGRYFIFNIAPSRLREFIRSLSQKDPRQSIVLVNRRGEYICNTLHPESVSNKENFFDTGAYEIAVQKAKPFELTEFPAHYQKGDSFVKGILDEDHFITYMPQEEMGWLILIRDYYDNLDPFLNKMLAIAVLFIFLSVFLMSIAIKITTDRIMNPVESLIDRINRFAKGDTENFLPVDPENTYPIFVSLLASFNNMQKQIHERREELQELNTNLGTIVSEKTKSLEDLNRNLEKIIEEKVAENLEIQRRLTLNEKLASMGEMIGNIAHQWRQPLSVIATLATGMKTQKELGVLSDDVFYHSCDQINDNAQYLSRTIDDFRDFIRGDKARSIFEINKIANRFRTLVESQISTYHITMMIELQNDLRISGYPNDLIQVWINIFNNAKDAFELNGITPRCFSIEAYQDSGSVEMVFTDNAGGIPDDVIDRVFEPYFTTKHPAQGTGLGLHMAYKLITAMGGEIRVENVSVTYDGVAYTGARFTITLPVYDTPEESEQA